MNVLGIGTEIIECLRIAQMIERHGERFLNRVFTDEEIRYCQQRQAATQHYAGHWVAKEAILKAVGTGWGKGIGWHDMEIRNEAGVSRVNFRGSLRDFVQRCGIKDIKISIAHCRSHASALAIALSSEDDS